MIIIIRRRRIRRIRRRRRTYLTKVNPSAEAVINGFNF